MSSFKKIIITTGDIDGIGFEVAAKALLHLGPQKNIVFCLFKSSLRPRPFEKKLLAALEKKFSIVTCSDFSVLEGLSLSSQTLVLIQSRGRPAKWVEAAALACLQKKASALVTGPLSKPEIKKAGLKELGHTEILKRICGARDVRMCFLGQSFNVLLATGHIPLDQVSSKLSTTSVLKTLRIASQFHKEFPAIMKKRPIGLLGLNPHAGDQKMIGHFESRVLSRVLRKAKKEKIPVVGPLVPDAAFHNENWNKFSMFIALYHDQGLIPFKLIHGFNSGVNLTLGLPICRTSVDHGTAKDIFGQNRANSGSMEDAIRWAIQLSC